MWYCIHVSVTCITFILVFLLYPLPMPPPTLGIKATLELANITEVSGIPHALKALQYLWRLDKTKKWDRPETCCAAKHYVYIHGNNLVELKSQETNKKKCYSWSGEHLKKKILEQIQSDMNECRPLAHLEQSVSVFLLLLFCFFFRVFAQLWSYPCWTTTSFISV